MTLCPCGSDLKFDSCCGPLIAGAPAPTAVALLRSRYTAYVRGEAAYIADTLAPEVRGEFDPTDAEGMFRNAEWEGLEVRTVTGGGTEDETGTIEFIARYHTHGQPQVHHELSTFRREGGRWFCSGGTVNPKSPPRQTTKIGRNAPCPCGSGKKYKKCCGG